MLKRFSLIKVATRIKNGQIVYCEDFANDGLRDGKDHDEHYEQFISRVKYAVKHDLIYSAKQSFSASATWTSNVGDPGTVAFATDIQADGQVISGVTDAGDQGSDNITNDIWNSVSVTLSDFEVKWSVAAPDQGGSAPDTFTGAVASYSNGNLATNNDLDSSIDGLNAGQQKDVKWTIDIRSNGDAGSEVAGSTVRHNYQELGG